MDVIGGVTMGIFEFSLISFLTFPLLLVAVTEMFNG